MSGDLPIGENRERQPAFTPTRQKLLRWNLRSVLLFFLLSIPLGAVAWRVNRYRQQVTAETAIAQVGGMVFLDHEIRIPSESGKEPMRSPALRFLFGRNVALVRFSMRGLVDGNSEVLDAQVDALLKHQDGLRGIRVIEFWTTEDFTSSIRRRLEPVFPRADVDVWVQ